MSSAPSPLYSALIDELVRERFAERLFQSDATLWGEAAFTEASTRLGWVNAPLDASRLVSQAGELRAQLVARGIDRVLLCGMGGSSLGPAVIARSSGAPLRVIETTHPTVMQRHLESDLSRTAVVFSSKSGGTVETISQAAAFRAAFERADIDPTERMIFITDPGSPLEERRELGYPVILANPQVGGRFSAFTAFGIVPSVLAGAAPSGIIADACVAREILSSNDPSNPALVLAAAIAAGLPERYLLVTAERSTTLSGLGEWIEQLIAESTGKDGRGVLPVTLPDGSYEHQHLPAAARRLVLEADVQAASLLEVSVSGHEITVTGSLGAQLLCWEAATAALGRLLSVNPFDQPDVEATKVAARAALDQSDAAVSASRVFPGRDALLAQLRDSVSADGYLAIQAFLDDTGEAADQARSLREMLAHRLGVPVALCWGPKYLHSTGQFHKGGPALGVFLQVLDEIKDEVPIPESPIAGFAALTDAEANGDRNVLRQRGRPVFEINTSDLAMLVAKS